MADKSESHLDARERFWSRVKKSDGCWLWTGAVNARGYGKLRHGGKIVQAHRLSWTITSGPIPRGLFVCHACDTPSCVRPDHLFTGTAQDNMDDMWRKGRGRGGLEYIKKLMRHRETLVDDLANLDGRIAKMMGKLLKQAKGAEKPEKDGVML